MVATRRRCLDGRTTSLEQGSSPRTAIDPATPVVLKPPSLRRRPLQTPTPGSLRRNAASSSASTLDTQASGTTRIDKGSVRARRPAGPSRRRGFRAGRRRARTGACKACSSRLRSPSAGRTGGDAIPSTKLRSEATPVQHRIRGASRVGTKFGFSLSILEGRALAGVVTSVSSADPSSWSRCRHHRLRWSSSGARRRTPKLRVTRFTGRQHVTIPRLDSGVRRRTLVAAPAKKDVGSDAPPLRLHSSFLARVVGSSAGGCHHQLVVVRNFRGRWFVDEATIFRQLFINDTKT
ncbi:hypothetical protein GGR04_003131 [Aureimonas pseudogalii]|uniref:Uncharacterized protein n=1 Tax=Aureimonas pseudogalii TaxID=1744844 RepID=A0A7W6H631_9HYPH|nr:hypothetical protein [Aureimonas pseudogalii]